MARQRQPRAHLPSAPALQIECTHRYDSIEAEAYKKSKRFEIEFENGHGVWSHPDPSHKCKIQAVEIVLLAAFIHLVLAITAVHA